MIPSSQRPDGSWRKPVKIRKGYGSEQIDRYVPPKYRRKSRGKEEIRLEDQRNSESRHRTPRDLRSLELQIQVEHDFYIVLAAELEIPTIEAEALKWSKLSQPYPEMFNLFMDQEKESIHWVGKASVGMDAENAAELLIKSLENVDAQHPGCCALLVCSSTLSKRNRAALHHQAQDRRMSSQSFGTGTNRFLTISTSETGLNVPSHQPLTPAQEDSAVQLWKWAQADQSGKYSIYSLGEIKEMVYHKTLSEHPLMDLRADMEVLYAFHRACKEADIEKVQQILSTDRSTLWKRHPETEELAIVEACNSGQAEVVQLLLEAGADVNTFSRGAGFSLVAMCEIKGLEQVSNVLARFASHPLPQSEEDNDEHCKP